jgi:1-deoxy-D-xylulose-5-phosphate synthase
VLEALAEHAPGVRVRRLGLPDQFIEHGDTDAQWRDAGIDAAGIAGAAERALEADRRG